LEAFEIFQRKDLKLGGQRNFTKNRNAVSEMLSKTCYARSNLRALKKISLAKRSRATAGIVPALAKLASQIGVVLSGIIRVHKVNIAIRQHNSLQDGAGQRKTGADGHVRPYLFVSDLPHILN
jgi:hypothetical protein